MAEKQDPSEAACKAYAADCEANREQEAASTTFDLGFSPGGSAGAGRPHVILRLEAETAAETRRLMAVLRFALLFGFFTLIAELIMKIAKSHRNWFSRPVLILNCVVAAICCAGLLRTLLVFTHRLNLIRVSGKTWSRRRARLSALYFALLVVQLLNAVFYLLPNAYSLGGSCPWYGAVVDVSGFVRWTMWMSAMLLLAVAAHFNAPWAAPSTDGAVRTGSIILDAPLWKHLPKVVLWLACEANLIYLLVKDRQLAGRKPDREGFGYDCLGRTVECPRPYYATISSGILLSTFGLWLLIITYLLVSAFFALSKLPYAQYRVANLIVRLQFRTSYSAGVCVIVSALLLWFVRETACASYIFTWLGLLPCQAVMAALVVVLASFFMPRNDDQEFVMLAALQKICWLERESHEQLAARAADAQSPAAKASLAHQPMFCFETALKALYFSFLVYEFEEPTAGAAEVEADVEAVDALEGPPVDVPLEDALGLYGLDAATVFREPVEDSKALVAWGADTIVIAFRGTASFQNMLNDIQAWQVSHPPVRGMLCDLSRPMVHRGFLRSWRAAGFNERIIGHVRGLIAAHGLDVRSMRVLITGHSLGGALATLAAYDLQAEFGFRKLQVYAFGSPRTGNHAFARDYERKVPHTWHVVNDQDTVTRMAKFLFVYKRPGQRCIINSFGDLIVRPFPLELSLNLNLTGSKVSQHLLTSYAASLVTVVEAQFTTKQLPGGSQGCQELLRNPVIYRLLYVAGLAPSLHEEKVPSQEPVSTLRCPWSKSKETNIRRTDFFQRVMRSQSMQLPLVAVPALAPTSAAS